MASIYQAPARFYSLDVLRGILCPFIIFFHWQHFFYDVGEVSSEFEVTSQPLFAVIKPLYTQGIYAVDFFLSLSGFIMFWLYSEAINAKKVSAYRYAALRFSRLYPLHIVTLLLVVLAQYLSTLQSGHFLVYQENDWYHLWLNIFFVNAWGIEKDFSFNGPSWTVSVEVFMYIIFFILSYIFKARSLLVVAILCSVMGFFIERNVHPLMGMGFHSFFAGGVAYIAYSKLLNYDLKAVLMVLSPLCVFLWIIAIADIYSDFGAITPFLKSSLPSPFFHMLIDAFHTSLIGTAVIIPLTILVFAVAETLRGNLGKRLHGFGDMSYALYLFHFPLQLAFILVANSLGVDRSFFYTITSVVLFFLILFPLAYVSYFYFEAPSQRFLRKLLIRKRRR